MLVAKPSTFQTPTECSSARKWAQYSALAHSRAQLHARRAVNGGYSNEKVVDVGADIYDVLTTLRVVANDACLHSVKLTIISNYMVD